MKKAFITVEIDATDDFTANDLNAAREAIFRAIALHSVDNDRISDYEFHQELGSVH